MIQAYFRRIYMESSEHKVHDNSAYIVFYISPPICTNGLIFSKCTYFIVFFLDMPAYPIISQI